MCKFTLALTSVKEVCSAFSVCPLCISLEPIVDIQKPRSAITQHRSGFTRILRLLKSR